MHVEAMGFISAGSVGDVVAAAVTIAGAAVIVVSLRRRAVRALAANTFSEAAGPPLFVLMFFVGMCVASLGLGVAWEPVGDLVDWLTGHGPADMPGGRAVPLAALGIGALVLGLAGLVAFFVGMVKCRPLFVAIILLSIALLVIVACLPMFAFSFEVNMLRDIGMASITVSGLLVAIFTATTVLADEIERKTVLTVLSKPVTRAEFVLGKFFGVACVVAATMLILGVALHVAVFLKAYGVSEGFASRYSNPGLAAFTMRYFLPGEMGAWGSIATGEFTRTNFMSLNKAIFLSFLQVTVLASFSVAVSTRVSMVVNVAAVVSIYLLGHLTEVIRERLVAADYGPAAMGVFAVFDAIVPNLENFNLSRVLVLGNPAHTATLGYLWQSAAYAGVFVAAGVVLGMILFEKREVS